MTRLHKVIDLAIDVFSAAMEYYSQSYTPLFYIITVMSRCWGRTSAWPVVRACEGDAGFLTPGFSVSHGLWRLSRASYRSLGCRGDFLQHFSNPWVFGRAGCVSVLSLALCAPVRGD